MSVSKVLLKRASVKTGVPLWLLQAVDRQEGSGTSPKGAKGEFQLMPRTARGLERKYGINTQTTWGNVLGGAYYLAEQYKSFGRWDYALAAYNAGPNAVRKYGGIPPFKETQDYVRKILSGAGGKVPGVAGGPTTPPGAVPNEVAAPPQPSYTQEDALREGLSALALGHYDPEQGLAALQKAADAASVAAEAARQAVPTGASWSFPDVQAGTSKLDKAAAAFVKSALGTPYVWGGSKPGGFDCSGLLFWAWARAGVMIPRTSQEQWAGGMPVKTSQLRLGDAVFFKGSRGQAPGHVGFYIGNGQFIEAPKTGDVVKVSRLAGRKDYMGARRFA